MYFKMTLRNITRCIVDYIVYFITLTLAISLIFSFLNLAFSESVLSLSQNMSNLSSIILFLSLIVSIIVGFTINYVTKFIVDKRRREFATYVLLGMEPKLVSRLFFVENLLIGFISLICGLFLGIFISQIIIVLIMNIFNTMPNMKITFSYEAIFITIFCFSIIYILNTLIFSASIRKQKVIKLMYASTFNEKMAIKNPLINIFITIVSIVIIIISFIILKTGLIMSGNESFIYILFSFILIILSLIGIYMSLPCFIISIFEFYNKWKYKNINLVLLKQISSKINSYRKINAILAVLLTISLCIMSLGLSMASGYKSNMSLEAPFDIAIGLDIANISNFNEILNFVDTIVPIKEYVDYQLYKYEQLSDITIISLSDYNKLRDLLNIGKKYIYEDEFIIHCDTWYLLDEIKNSLENKNTINLSNNFLKSNTSLIFTEPLEQYRINGENGYAIIVPDYVTNYLQATKSRLVISTLQEAPQTIKDDLNNFIRNDWKPVLKYNLELPDHVTLNISVKSWSIANSLTSFSILSFSGLYLSIVFIILVGTIITLQQISNGVKTKHQYNSIRIMGVSDNDINRLIFKDVLISFITPLFTPIIFAIILSLILNNYLGEFILSKNIILIYTFISIIIFLIVYIFYFIATFLIYKHNIYTYINDYFK